MVIVMIRPTLQRIMMQLAHSLSKRSKDPKTKVGCVICDEDLERVVSIGYNGGAKGQSDERDSDEPGQSNLIHAEANALVKCDYSIPNKVVFLTHSPCVVCSKMLVNAKVKKVYYSEPFRDWKESKKILENAGINVEWLV